MDRIIEDKFSSLDIVYRETHKVKGLLLRDRILNDKKQLEDGKRLGATYFSALLMEWAGGQATFTDLKPKDSSEGISDSLVQALECCVLPNPAQRTTEPLEALLRHAGPMNQTEIYGMVKAVIANQMLGQPMKDVVILEVMNYLSKVQLQDSWPNLMQALGYITLHPTPEIMNT